MAPELLLGEVESANQESDMWAFACVCYEVFTCFYSHYIALTPIKILSGTMPFAEYAHNTTALIKAFSKPGTIPTKPTGGVDGRVWKKMEKCWDYNPTKRPTAKDICNFFASLGIKDDRPRVADNSRVRFDNTGINFEVIYAALLRVGRGGYPSKIKADTPSQVPPASS
jgi:serine/threonine protein kinase